MAAQPQYSKFSPVTVQTKKNIRKLRMNAGYSMNEGSRRLGVSRKQLEDIETLRNYGCHIDLEVLAKVAQLYNTDFKLIIGLNPQLEDAADDYFERPRKRLGSKPR